MGILRQADWNAGSLPAYNRREEAHESDMATAEMGRQNTQADLYAKTQKLDEDKYKHEELIARRRERDAISENKETVASYDTDDRLVHKALQLVQSAEQSGDPGLMEDAYDAMSQASPYFKAELEKAKPEEREELLGNLMTRHAESMDVSRKGRLMGMQGDQDRQNIGLQNQGRMDVAQAQIDSREEIAGLDRESQEYIAQNYGSGAIQMLRDLQNPAVGGERLEETREMLDSMQEKNRKVAGGANTRIAEQKEWDRITDGGMKAAMSSFTTEYSGGGDAPKLNDETKWAGVPGFREMRSQVGKLVESGELRTESQAHEWMTGNFILMEKKRGFIQMPQKDGKLFGPKNASDLLYEARQNPNMTLEDVMDDYALFLFTKRGKYEWKR